MTTYCHNWQKSTYIIQAEGFTLPRSLTFQSLLTTPLKLPFLRKALRMLLSSKPMRTLKGFIVCTVADFTYFPLCLKRVSSNRSTRESSAFAELNDCLALVDFEIGPCSLKASLPLVDENTGTASKWCWLFAGGNVSSTFFSDPFGFNDRGLDTVLLRPADTISIPEALVSPSIDS
jgi:hypothetical protein